MYLYPRRNREKEIDDARNSMADRELVGAELFAVARETEEFRRAERNARRMDLVGRGLHKVVRCYKSSNRTAMHLHAYTLEDAVTRARTARVLFADSSRKFA